MSRTVLVTGAAGFIGAELSKRLLLQGDKVVGIDNLNNYYDPSLKQARLLEIDKASKCGSWRFKQMELEDEIAMLDLFAEESPQIVVNLAAQAGVRYSLKNPSAYIQSNLVGFGNLLECCRQYGVKNLVYASSSSVYGGNRNLPFHEQQSVNHPVSLYAATKKANELMAHSYSHLYSLPCTGLRFFTVYGPWGRPDMAPMLFAKAILADESIKVFNHGNMKRDFTYIDDVIEGVVRCCGKPASPDPSFDTQCPNPSTSYAPYRIFNIGNNRPIQLLRFIELLEEALGRKAIKVFEPIQPGDVEETASDTLALENWIGKISYTKLEKGVKIFAEWYVNNRP